MVFCNVFEYRDEDFSDRVTILILIDGFLQFKMFDILIFEQVSHNPYFNRWFSAILMLMMLY